MKSGPSLTEGTLLAAHWSVAELTCGSRELLASGRAGDKSAPSAPTIQHTGGTFCAYLHYDESRRDSDSVVTYRSREGPQTAPRLNFKSHKPDAGTEAADSVAPFGKWLGPPSLLIPRTWGLLPASCVSWTIKLSGCNQPTSARGFVGLRETLVDLFSGSSWRTLGSLYRTVRGACLGVTRDSTRGIGEKLPPCPRGSLFCAAHPCVAGLHTLPFAGAQKGASPVVHVLYLLLKDRFKFRFCHTVYIARFTLSRSY